MKIMKEQNKINKNFVNKRDIICNAGYTSKYPKDRYIYRTPEINYSNIKNIQLL